MPARRVNTDGQSRQEWFIWANRRADVAESVIFTGDNRTSRGKGDDESIIVDLDKVPSEIVSIKFQVVIWDAIQKGGQTFGQVENAFIRVYDQNTGEEIARYNLGSNFADETLVIFGELYRRGTEWKFRAIGEGYDAAKFRKEHGVESPFDTEFARFRN